MNPVSTPEPATAPVAAEPASFRDPAGHVFWRDGRLFRYVAPAYRPHYDAVQSSGAYARWVEQGRLIAHREHPAGADAPAGALVLEPELVPFVSHPYEWSFAMLQDAALLTLDLQADCLAHGLTLKDASAYNVQFRCGRPVLIDTLSFEQYREGTPWVAYRQFCQHFLAPLALIAHRDERLAALTRTALDGVPLDLASKLLPRRTWASLGLLTHLHLHARSQRQRSASDARGLERRAAQARVRSGGVRAIVQNLRDTVAALQWRPAGSTWSDYYATADHYGAGGVDAKTELVEQLLRASAPGVVWDLGANTGRFSELAARHHRAVVAWDGDALCVDHLYRRLRAAGETPITPLVLDLANPSPQQGWAQAERRGLIERGPADVVLALGLMHHLVLAAQVPVDRLAEFLARVGRTLVIEFVPLDDPQAALLASRLQGRGHQYDRAQFEAAFRRHFHLRTAAAVPGTSRVLYHFIRS